MGVHDSFVLRTPINYRRNWPSLHLACGAFQYNRVCMREARSVLVIENIGVTHVLLTVFLYVCLSLCLYIPLSLFLSVCLLICLSSSVATSGRNPSLMFLFCLEYTHGSSWNLVRVITRTIIFHARTYLWAIVANVYHINCVYSRW